MIFLELEEFRRDLKFLVKKYRSLIDDLEVLKKVLAVLPNESPPFSFEISDLGLSTCVLK
jgi:mRNA-degrading endonuclease YafQ of YafQ-DinJ toxin-antitoxin module